MAAAKKVKTWELVFSGGGSKFGGGFYKGGDFSMRWERE